MDETVRSVHVCSVNIEASWSFAFLDGMHSSSQWWVSSKKSFEVCGLTQHECMALPISVKGKD